MERIHIKNVSVSLLVLLALGTAIVQPLSISGLRRFLEAYSGKGTYVIPDLQIKQPSYEVQMFSRDPLILYIKSFLSADEISYLLQQSDGNFDPSKVWRGGDGRVDPKVRISETAPIKHDNVTQRIGDRALLIQGWRPNHAVESLKVQRYAVGGYYNHHYDWDSTFKTENRAGTFMVYLSANCTGGGTNFPRIERPVDERWCEYIECGDDGNIYPGVTFKPIAGSAVYWENLHPNGTGHNGTLHAGLPVLSGVKVGMNIWSWDLSWRPPSA